MNIFQHRLAADIPLLTIESLAWMASAALSEKDVQAAEHPYFKRLREDMKPKMEMMGDVAIVPIQGALAYNPSPWEMLLYGMEDSRSVLRMVNEAAYNPQAKGILLRMDTPGGMMLGGPEIADAVAAANTIKPVVAHVGGLGASLGYMIASQASEIVASRSSLVGSIGVISSVTDYTAYLEKLGIKFEYFTNKEAKFKATGAVGTSLNDDQRNYLQERVDSAFQIFKGTVLSARPGVKPEAMRGQVFRGEEAVKIGLADAMGTEEGAMHALRLKINAKLSA